MTGHFVLLRIAQDPLVARCPGSTASSDSSGSRKWLTTARIEPPSSHFATWAPPSRTITARAPIGYPARRYRIRVAVQ